MNPIVSVCMITYNHENFISEAIEGVLMQKTNFPIELVIGEDCSNDNTRKICQHYAEKYQNTIRLLPSERNLGMMPNFIRTLKECNWKYIALCEGDDYWTDPYKLQKQVDFLEANEEYSAAVHNVKILENGRLNGKMWTWKSNRDLVYKDFFTGNKISTLSLVVRAEYAKIPDVFSKIPTGDYVLALLASKQGPIKYFADCMGVYRKHAGGIWTARTSNIEKEIKLNKTLIESFKILANEFPENSDGFVKQSFNKMNALRFNYLFTKEIKKSVIVAIDMLKHMRYISSLSVLLSLTTNLVCPWLLRRRYINKLKNKQ